MPLDALAGIKVVEMGQNLAAPYAAGVLGDLGARVIKVEKPGGDDCRGWGPPFVAGDSVSFHLMNRNKQSVVLSLDKPADMAAFLRLVGEADVFVHNLRPGVAERFGIDGPTLTKAQPKLVYCEMNAFGHAGELRSKPGYEPLLQAFAGLVSVNGDPEGPASRIGPSVVDLGTGMWSVIGIIAALFRRASTGQGGIVETSLFETALGWVARHVADYGATGQIPPRVGTGHNSLTPYQAFETADGPLIVAAGNDRLFAKLAHVLGCPHWAEDARFATNAQRTRNRDELLPMIAKILAARPAADWVAVLEKVGVPCSPVHSVPQVLAHPQTRALGMLLDTGNPQLQLLGLPLSIDGRRPGYGAAAPALGAHQKDLS